VTKICFCYLSTCVNPNSWSN